MIKRYEKKYCLNNEKIAVQTAVSESVETHGHDFLELAYIAGGSARHFFENSQAVVGVK